jgi:hypothetical protein
LLFDKSGRPALRLPSFEAAIFFLDQNPIIGGAVALVGVEARVR